MYPKTNYLAVISATVLYMIMGMAWYGVFATPWLRLQSKTSSDAMAAGTLPYVIAAITGVIIALMLSWMLPRLGARTLAQGLRASFILGIGLLFTTGTTTYAFSGRPMALGLIDHLYHVVSITLMGGLIAAWKKSPQRAPSAMRI